MSDQSNVSYASYFKGCHKDDAARNLKTSFGNLTVAACAAKAKTNGNKYFGMQYPQGSPANSGKAQCFTGDTYGGGAYTPVKCNTAAGFTDAAGNKLGDGWVNAIYEVPSLENVSPAELAVVMGKTAGVQKKYDQVGQIRADDEKSKKSEKYDDLDQKERDLTVTRDVTLIMAAASSLLLVYTFIKLRG